MVSVIIPAYREAERIGLTLAGVRRGAAALDEPVEVVVVDDGSDDGTAEQALATSKRSAYFVFRIRQSQKQARLCRIRNTKYGIRTTPVRLTARTPDRPVVRVVRLEQNRGKGAALARGLAEARGEWFVLLDADLEETAAEFPCLLAPVRAGLADMTIAIFGDGGRGGGGDGGRRGGGDGARGRRGGRQGQGQTFSRGDRVPLSPRRPVAPSPRRPVAPSPPPPVARGGFGLALRTARWGVARLTGRVLEAPLSGQRAFRAAHLPLLTPLEPGFGLEVGLDIDALWGGLRVVEVPTSMAHAATGRDWAGCRHRGRQLAHILRALWRRQTVKGRGRQ
jgi:glycosyl transferase family 2